MINAIISVRTGGTKSEKEEEKGPKSEVKDDASSEDASDDEKDNPEDADVRDVKYRLETLGSKIFLKNCNVLDTESEPSETL